jgi:ApaG protein
MKISVATGFEGTYYQNYGYSTSVTNHHRNCKNTVQLMSSLILDSLNDEEIVDGEGVIGKNQFYDQGSNTPIWLPVFTAQ